MHCVIFLEKHTWTWAGVKGSVGRPHQKMHCVFFLEKHTWTWAGVKGSVGRPHQKMHCAIFLEKHTWAWGGVKGRLGRIPSSKNALCIFFWKNIHGHGEGSRVG